MGATASWHVRSRLPRGRRVGIGAEGSEFVPARRSVPNRIPQEMPVRNLPRFAMKGVKAVRVKQKETGGRRRQRHARPRQQNKQTMNAITKIALVLTTLTIAAAAQADRVRGYIRSNGTYVAPHYRTPANGIPYDNLSYRGYPSQQPGYVSPRANSFGSPSSRSSSFSSGDFGFRPSGFGQPSRLPAFSSDFEIKPLRNRDLGF